MSRDMTKGPVLRTILLFMLPIFLGQILQMTYNIVDSIVVGRFVSEAALAGVAATYTPITLFNALVLGFSTGAGVVVAQFFGAKREDMLCKTFSTTYLCVIVGGFIMMAVVFFCARPLLKYVLGTPEEDGVLDMAVTYLRVYYAGAVFIFLYNLLAGCLRSMGDSVFPLVFLIVSCVVNIILDLVLVLWLHLDVVGVALASAASQAIACLCAIVYIRLKYPIMWYKPKQFVFDGEVFRLAMRLGIPEAINTGISSVCFMWQQRLVNSFGAAAMGAFLAGQRVDQLVGMPLIITGVSMAPFSGQNCAAGKMDRVYKARRQMMLAGCIFAIVLTPVLVVFRRQLLGMFVADAGSLVVEYGCNYLVRIAPFYLFLCVTQVTMGVMRGAGDARFATILSFWGLVARIAAAYVLAYACGLGLNGVWLSTGVGFVLSMLPTLARFYQGGWKKKIFAKAEAGD